MSETATGSAGTPPVSVVVVAFNEASVIEDVVRGFMEEVVDKCPGSELIVAEDGSSDGTDRILRDIAPSYPSMRLLQGAERKGYLKAYMDAMSAAKNDLILFCDASGKHDPADFWRMLPLTAKHDMVVGYKEDRRDPIYRTVMSRVFNWMVRTYFGVHLHDVNCPLRLMRRSAYEASVPNPWLLKDLTNFELSIRMVYKGFDVIEIPIRHFARKEGPSRGLPFRTIPKVVWRTLRNFRQLKREAKG